MPEPFVYFGSYFKRTQVADVAEFDVLVVVDSNTGVFNTWGSQLGAGSGSVYPNPKCDPRYSKADGSGVSPSKMLNWLRDIVGTVTVAYGGAAPERVGQAIIASIPSSGLFIDLVPAGVFSRLTDGTTLNNLIAGASLTWYASRLDTIVQELFDLENESDATIVQERVAEAFSNAL